MAERIEADDARPPSPPPDTEPRDWAREVTPGLSNALAHDDQAADVGEPGTEPRGTADRRRQAEPPAFSSADVPAGPADPDSRESAPDHDGSRSEPGPLDLPKADVGPELRSALIEPDGRLPGPSEDHPVSTDQDKLGDDLAGPTHGRVVNQEWTGASDPAQHS